MFKVIILALVLFAAGFLLINFRPGEGIQGIPPHLLPVIPECHSRIKPVGKVVVMDGDIGIGPTLIATGDGMVKIGLKYFKHYFKIYFDDKYR